MGHTSRTKKKPKAAMTAARMAPASLSPGSVRAPRRVATVVMA
jgi:hypothetical protein